METNEEIKIPQILCPYHNDIISLICVDSTCQKQTLQPLCYKCNQLELHKKPYQYHKVESLQVFLNTFTKQVQQQIKSHNNSSQNTQTTINTLTNNNQFSNNNNNKEQNNDHDLSSLYSPSYVNQDTIGQLNSIEDKIQKIQLVIDNYKKEILLSKVKNSQLLEILKQSSKSSNFILLEKNLSALKKFLQFDSQQNLQMIEESFIQKEPSENMIFTKMVNSLNEVHRHMNISCMFMAQYSAQIAQKVDIKNTNHLFITNSNSILFSQQMPQQQTIFDQNQANLISQQQQSQQQQQQWQQQLQQQQQQQTSLQEINGILNKPIVEPSNKNMQRSLSDTDYVNLTHTDLQFQLSKLRQEEKERALKLKNFDIQNNNSNSTNSNNNLSGNLRSLIFNEQQQQQQQSNCNNNNILPKSSLKQKAKFDESNIKIEAVNSIKDVNGGLETATNNSTKLSSSNLRKEMNTGLSLKNKRRLFRNSSKVSRSNGEDNGEKEDIEEEEEENSKQTYNNIDQKENPENQESEPSIKKKLQYANSISGITDQDITSNKVKSPRQDEQHQLDLTQDIKLGLQQHQQKKDNSEDDNVNNNNKNNQRRSSRQRKPRIQQNDLYVSLEEEIEDDEEQKSKRRTSQRKKNNNAKQQNSILSIEYSDEEEEENQDQKNNKLKIEDEEQDEDDEEEEEEEDEEEDDEEEDVPLEIKNVAGLNKIILELGTGDFKKYNTLEILIENKKDMLEIKDLNNYLKERLHKVFSYFKNQHIRKVILTLSKLPLGNNILQLCQQIPTGVEELQLGLFRCNLLDGQDDSNFDNFFKFLSSLKSLQKLTLDIGNNQKLHMQRFVDLIEKGIANIPKLTSLDLIISNYTKSNRVEFINKLITPIGKLKKLKELGLGFDDCYLNEKCIEAFRQLKNLNIYNLALYLNYNSVGNEGCKIIAEVIEQYKELEMLTLQLAHNSVTDADFKYIIDALDQLKELNQIDIGLAMNGEIKEETTLALSQVISKNKTKFVYLDLKNCGVTKKARQHLNQVKRKFHQFTY